MAATPGTIKLSSGTLNVRKTASKTASIVTKLSNGDSVDIISKTSNSAGAWYKIEANGKTGYVLQQYVKVGSSSGGATTTSKTGTVRTSTMKIYKSKSSKSTLLATAKKGDTVDILQLTSSSSWAKVKYNGKTGYCAKSSLTVGGSTGGSTTPRLHRSRFRQPLRSRGRAEHGRSGASGGQLLPVHLHDQLHPAHQVLQQLREPVHGLQDAAGHG